MRVLHVVQHLHRISGVSVYCANVCDALKRIGVEVDIAVQDLTDPNQINSIFSVRRFQVNEVCRRSCEYDLVHIHNLWTPVLHHASRWASQNQVPVVWSLHGTLSPWAFKYKWWKKLPVWIATQRQDLRRASVLHVTSDVESNWVRQLGFVKIINIPMGTLLPDVVDLERTSRSKTLLFVGRIAPVKALPKLIAAWSRVHRKDWKLRIVGSEDFPGYTDYLKDASVRMGVSDSIEFPGPKFGEDLEGEYRRAAALALVSETENFGAVVADALAHGLPVVTTRGTPWHEVAQRGCGWNIENSEDDIVEALNELLSLEPNKRFQMGFQGRKLVSEKYSWPAVARRMLISYESVVRPITNER